MSTIKTPDQMILVCISSTIKVLADERMAARQAVENFEVDSGFI